MHLLIDIGNSTIVAALADGNGDITCTWRFKTQKDADRGFFRRELLRGVRDYNIKVEDISALTVSSVVPEINDIIREITYEVFGIHPHFFSVDDALRVINIDVDAPSMLGKDRIADAIGAAKCYGVPAIVFDMGTATTVGVVNEQNTFLGGMIIPGAKTALRALSSRASQLPEVEVAAPKNIIGRNTLECMQSGIVHGSASMIDGLIDRLSATLPQPVHVIATGGMSRFIIPHCSHDIIIDPHLQFKGLWASQKQCQE